MALKALSPMRWLCGLVLLVSAANGLKFDLLAHPGGENLKKERCIRNFVSSDTLVVVTSTVDGFKGDGMLVNIHVCPLSYILVRGEERKGRGGTGQKGID